MTKKLPIDPIAREIFVALDASSRTQRELADHIGISDDMASKVRNDIRQFKAAEAAKARRWLGLDGGQESEQPITITSDGGETTSILSLDLSLSMGPGTPIEEFVESTPVEFDIGVLRTITRTPFHRLRFVRGIGDSMEPKFYTGDRILVDTTERSLGRLDGYYWITLWGAHGLKRLRPIGRDRVRIISENPSHEPIDVDAEEITIEGRAIWLGRDL